MIVCAIRDARTEQECHGLNCIASVSFDLLPGSGENRYEAELFKKRLFHFFYNLHLITEVCDCNLKRKCAGTFFKDVGPSQKFPVLGLWLCTNFEPHLFLNGNLVDSGQSD